MGILDKLFRKKVVREESSKRAVRLEDIIRAERIELVQDEEEDTRYCYQCGEIIRKGNGYLLQGGIQAWLAELYARGTWFSGFTSLSGTSLEIGESDHPLIKQQMWYWYCNDCGSTVMRRDLHGKFVNGAKHFWKTGTPPKRRPLIEGIDY